MAKAKKKEKEAQVERVVITAPDFGNMTVPLIGSAILVVHRFSEKAKKEMLYKHTHPTVKSKLREAKNPEELFQSCLYVSEEGWYGFPASAFRAASIRACSLVGVKMTEAKMTLFIVADGYDKFDGTPLCRITSGLPQMHMSAVRIQSTTDIRVRAMFREGWKMNLKMRWDNAQLDKTDVVNLINRVGIQVGIGEGRPSSPKSCGMGWGTFDISSKRG